MFDEELKLPVSVRLSSVTGLFLVSEPDNESTCSQNRRELEQELYEFLTKSAKKTKNEMREEPNLKINDMVAVKQMDNKTWFRGLIQNKIHYRLGARWTILLLDWGRIIEAPNDDVLPLPGKFCHQPCYSQRAILAGIVPIKDSMDSEEPVTQYCPGTKFFIENIFGFSPQAKMTVVGVDRAHYLHIRLYFKLPGRSEYFCLNDTLCEKNFAERNISEDLKPVQFDPVFWENLPRLPFQPAPLPDSADVGMRDYVNEYQRLRQALQNAAVAIRKGSSSSSPSAASEGSRGRGVALLREQISSEVKRPPSSSSSSSVSSTKGRGAAILRELMRTQPGKAKADLDSSLDSSSESGSVALSDTSGKSRGRGVARLREKILSEAKRPPSSSSSSSLASATDRRSTSLNEVTASQSGKPNADLDSSLDSSFDNGNLTDSSSASGILIGVARFKRDTEKVPIGRASTRLAAAQVLQPPEPQVGAEATESNVPKPKTDEQRVTFRPGGMPVPSQPPRWTRPFVPPEPRPYVNLGARPRTRFPFRNPRPQGLYENSQQVRRPQQEQPENPSAGRPTPHIQTLQPKQNQQLNGNQQKPEPKQQVHIQPRPTLLTLQDPTASRANNKLEEAYRPQTQSERMVQVKLPESKVQNINELLELAESSKSAGVQARQPQVVKAEPLKEPEQVNGQGKSPNELKEKTDENLDEKNKKEEMEKKQQALQLKLKEEHEEMQRNQSSQPPTFQGAAFQQLQPSRTVELTQQGRVLIRSRLDPPPPRFVLNEIPFKTPIQEALNIMGIFRPKLIQAHVWETILPGYNVAFVAGNRSGKTLGYLVPVLNNLLDKKDYNNLPKGISPLVIVICPSWQNAEVVNEYCREVMRRVPGFSSAVLSDGTSRTIKDSLSHFVNGVTLLAATPPALLYILEEAKTLMNFDRCCHLILENADTLLQENGAVMKGILHKYYESVKRISPHKPDASGETYTMPRQMIACATYWTPGMQVLTEKGMGEVFVFISSSMEAAIFGGMKLDVARGTRNEMDERLVSLVLEKHTRRPVVFCRSEEEVMRLAEKLTGLGVTALLAHNQTLVFDLDFVAQRWKQGRAVLLCTDDVVERLNIRDATTLIHYYIPQHSKYDFTYRFSLSLDKFSADGADEEDKPESYLLITEEFNNALLSIVRFMQRFGLPVPDDLITEAVFSFCNKEMNKRDNVLCHFLKTQGTCRHLKFCSARHIILKELDSPPPQWPVNGLVRVLITAVQGTTRFYGRILKARGQDRKVNDSSAEYLKFFTRMKSVCEAATKANKAAVQVGNVYGWLDRDGDYIRIRIESVKHFDRDDHATEVEAFCIDKGDMATLSVCELFLLPEEIKSHPPLVAEILLVGLKPYDGSTTWNRYSLDFVRDKIIKKELDGRIVLALNSTLWLDPLVHRKRLGSAKTHITLLDIRKELIQNQLAKENEGHIEKLHEFCVTGGFELPDYSVGFVAKSDVSNEASISYAFLPPGEPTEVRVSAVKSPHTFYVRIHKFSDTLRTLEKDIQDAVAKCFSLEEKDIQPGQLCLARCNIDDNWYRARVREVGPAEESSLYEIFYVDYGVTARARSGDLKVANPWMIERMPFQAIACSLAGIIPFEECWNEDAIDLFKEIVQVDRMTDPMVLTARIVLKDPQPDPVTLGPFYSIRLIHGTTNADVAEYLIQQEFGLKVDTPSVPDEPIVQAKKPVELDENAFDVSPEWVDCFRKRQPPEKKPSGVLQVSEPKPFIPPVSDEDAPVKSTDSRFPTTKWSQNDQQVIITFHLPNVDEYQLELEQQKLNFLANINGNRYELQVKLFGEIVPDGSSHGLEAKGVRVVLKKADTTHWMRLPATTLKLPWLSRDFDTWSSDSDEEVEDKPPPLIDPERVFGDYQSDSESSYSDDMDDFGDIKAYDDDDEDYY